MKKLLSGAALVLAALAAGTSFSQNYPTKPVRIIAPFAPGGGTDFIARLLAQKLTERLGQQVIVENKPGAGGNLGAEFAVKSAPDGYTLLLIAGSYTVNPSLYAKPPYDPDKDFAPVTKAAGSPNGLFVHPSIPAKSVKELVELIKANPGKYTFASPGIGTTPHLSGELFKLVGAINMTHVPFSGAGPAIQAILSGTTQVAFAALPPAHPHIESGALKALAVTGAHRWFDLPDVPTMVELGYKDFISDTFQGFLAPARTPPAIVELLSTKSLGILKTPKISEQLRNDGFEVLANGPDGMRKRIEDEVPKWRDIIAKAGIQPV